MIYVSIILYGSPNNFIYLDPKFLTYSHIDISYISCLVVPVTVSRAKLNRRVDSAHPSRGKTFTNILH